MSSQRASATVTKFKKRRPEIMKPALKQLTPHEKKVIATVGLKVSEMWKDLFSRNKWKSHE